MPTMGQICFDHVHCTDCPVRAQCTVRPMFYDEDEYQEWRSTTIEMTKHVATLAGAPEFIASMGANAGIQMMDRRREHELKLYPKYSPK